MSTITSPNSLGSLCLTTPQLPLIAGVSTVSAVYDRPFWNKCQAHLFFVNPAFEPTTFNFDQGSCFEQQIAEFLVPAGAPNGEAYLIWDCEGLSPICIQVIISQGQNSADPNSTQNGDIICVPDAKNTGVPSGNSSLHRPGLAPTQASGWDWPISSSISVTDMPHAITPSFPDVTSNLEAGNWDTTTSRTGTHTLSTTQSIETQFNTKTSDQSNDKTGDGIFGFPGVSSATRMLTIPGFGSKVLTFTRTITTLLTTTVPSPDSQNV